MKLSYLIFLLNSGLVSLTTIGAGYLSYHSWQNYQNITKSLASISDLRYALTAAEMVSKERGPSNAMLGAEIPAPHERIKKLEDARKNTNHAFSALHTQLTKSTPFKNIGSAKTENTQFIDIHQKLEMSRKIIDELIKQPKTQRSQAQIKFAIQNMVDIVPLIAPISSAIGGEAQQAFPELTSTLNGARLAAELREYTGLLGSLFTAPLATKQPFDQQQRIAIAEVQGRIKQLHFLLMLNIAQNTDQAIVQATENMTQSYFVQAIEYTQQIIKQGESTGQYELSLTNFIDRYVPDMNTILTLRDKLLDDATSKATYAQKKSLSMLITTVICSCVLIIITLLIIQIFRKKIIFPIFQTTKVVNGLTHGDFTTALPKHDKHNEIGAIIYAISTLQEQAKQKHQLERERDTLIEQLKNQSSTDYLTSLLNRRAFMEQVEGLLNTSKTEQKGVGIILLDIDYFKKLNDKYGHDVGDQALRILGKHLQQISRENDLCARFGGEEFIIAVEATHKEQLYQQAERLRKNIEKTPIEIGSEITVSITISLGISFIKFSSTQTITLEELIKQADMALYEAKNRGRNQSYVFNEDELKKQI